MQFREQRLANGLEIVAECNDEAHSTALGFFVKAGARDEWDEVAGVSHFLEHMVFKGTARRTAKDVNREFDEMGAHYNASTGDESTIYYAAVLPEYQNAALELLGDILRPALREEDFETEKQVIQEEIQMYADQPPYGADEKCREAFFGRHPLGRSVLGTVESVGGLSADAMRDYFRGRYSPSNIVLAAAGRVDFASLVAEAERICGGWAAFEAKRALEPAAVQSKFMLLRKPSSTLAYALQMTAGPAAADTDRYAAKILCVVLGDDLGSRLYWDLVDPGHVEQVSLGHHECQGAGAFVTDMACNPEDLGANLGRIAEVYAKAERDGITPDELSQAKSKVNSRIVLSSERPRSRLFAVGANWLQRREYRTVRDDLDIVERMTQSDIEAVLKKYPLTTGTTVAVGPLKKLEYPEGRVIKAITIGERGAGRKAAAMNGAPHNGKPKQKAKKGSAQKIAVKQRVTVKKSPSQKPAGKKAVVKRVVKTVAKATKKKKLASRILAKKAAVNGRPLKKKSNSRPAKRKSSPKGTRRRA